MNSLRLILVVGLATSLFIFCWSAAFAVDIYVVTSSGLTIGAEEVKDIFVGDKQVEGGVKLTPIDNASLKTEFLDKALHLTPEKYTQ